MNYDYIIVGAGIGGLSAGLNLAFNKKKVLILEKNSLPGGLVTTIKRGRFEFDASLYDLMDYGSEEHVGSLQRLFKKFNLDIDVLPIPYNIRIKSLDDKFDDIVEFSELRDFLDVPIRNFSSGMVAKLAFSIATIVNPEILMIGYYA